MPTLHPRVRTSRLRLTPSEPAAPAAANLEDPLLRALRAGDEEAFASLVRRLHGSLLRAAIVYVRDPAAAEDVVQEAWIGFLDGIERFEGRCSIKTWLFRILFNKAQTRAAKDQRLVPFSTLAAEEASSPWDSVDPPSFHGRESAGPGGHWVNRPPAWKTDPERILLDKEAIGAVKDAIDDLPPAQGTVILMRDVEGLSSKEVCHALGLSAANQRVLLHRARTRVRRALSTRYGSGD